MSGPPRGAPAALESSSPPIPSSFQPTYLPTNEGGSPADECASSVADYDVTVPVQALMRRASSLSGVMPP
jgi:hypothetical protein